MQEWANAILIPIHKKSNLGLLEVHHQAFSHIQIIITSWFALLKLVWLLGLI